jgi:hypothetical protein
MDDLDCGPLLASGGEVDASHSACAEPGDDLPPADATRLVDHSASPVMPARVAISHHVVGLHLTVRDPCRDARRTDLAGVGFADLHR